MAAPSPPPPLCQVLEDGRPVTVPETLSLTMPHAGGEADMTAQVEGAGAPCMCVCVWGGGGGRREGRRACPPSGSGWHVAVAGRGGGGGLVGPFESCVIFDTALVTHYHTLVTHHSSATTSWSLTTHLPPHPGHSSLM